MQDTDYRPSPCPNCGRLREAGPEPVCKFCDDVVPCPAASCSVSGSRCGLCGGTKEVTRVSAELYAEANARTPDKRKVNAKLSEAFIVKELVYLDSVAGLFPELHREMVSLINKHRPPNLTKDDVKDLMKSLFNSGVSIPNLDLVKRMMKELGLL